MALVITLIIFGIFFLGMIGLAIHHFTKDDGLYGF